ncbi:MAG TPA: M14 family zinc carboxypeptidase [Thermoanaerobaculia bacterium]
MARRFRIVALVFCVTLPALGQVPSPDEFLGYDIGARFTPHHRIVEYFDELQRTSPRIRIEHFGETYEGRSLLYAVITAEKHHAAIDDIRERIGAINRPDRTPAATAESIAKSTPVIVWLAFGVHGNESSSTEAAMVVAHRLLTAKDSTLDDAVVIIDPLENPDGRERYVSSFHRQSGLKPNADPQSFEHVEPWPGGRYNHYLFDMNRDWAWGSQRETRARVDAYRRWNPQVFVDFHEMSHQSTYFFPPDAHPINARIDKETAKWLEVFGMANAEAFARRAWPFFVAERFDLFYPAYGDSWPSLRGSIGMTYEMAGGGRAGRVVEKEDGTLLTLAERAEKHATTAMATIEAAVANRAELILHNYRALENHYNAAKTTYLILADSPNFVPAMNLLARQGIEVSRLRAPLRTKATRIDTNETTTHDFPVGTAIVSSKQPLSGLVDTLLERTAEFSGSFIEQQRARVEADEGDEFYDVTAWSLPISHNLRAFSVTTPVGELEPWAAPQPSAEMRSGKFGYLISAIETDVYRAAGRLLASGIRFSVSADAVTIGSRAIPRGSLVIQRSNNDASIDVRLREALRTTSVELIPVDSAWGGNGIALGSERIAFVREPNIAIVGGEGTSPTSFGALWHTFDVDFEIPHSVVPLNRLGAADLTKYRVLILPDGNGYADALKKNALDKMRSWIAAGGTVIAIRGAAAFLREKDVEISKLTKWEPPKKKDGEEATTPQRHNDFRIPGTAFATEMNERSYLTFGLQHSPAVLIEGTTALKPLPHKVDNIVTVRSEQPLVAGFAWPESIERIQGAPYLAIERVGRGRVITFADDPYFRLFWRGTLPLLLNAALYSPTFADR